MPEITTIVKAKSAYGIKAEEWGDEWANWSKPEFRGEPFNTEVKAGDRVQITYAEADNGKVYISTIDKLTTTAQRETAALESAPFPPDEEFPPEPAEAAPDGQDGQYRSPKDFRRTSALAQSVQRHTGPGSISTDSPATDEDIVLTAQRFERYLGSGE